MSVNPIPLEFATNSQLIHFSDSSNIHVSNIKGCIMFLRPTAEENVRAILFSFLAFSHVQRCKLGNLKVNLVCTYSMLQIHALRTGNVSESFLAYRTLFLPELYLGDIISILFSFFSSPCRKIRKTISI